MEMCYGNKNLKVLELGGKGVSTKFLEAYFPKWKIENYCEDLRQKNWEISDNQYDLIVSMEVIEHLSDVNETNFEWNASFLSTGLLNCLEESKRVVKKDGGRIFITTPNALSLINFYKMTMGEIPRQYNPHVREYTFEELKEVIDKVYLEINNFECIETLCICWDFSYISEFIEKAKGSNVHRASTLFFDLKYKSKG